MERVIAELNMRHLDLRVAYDLENLTDDQYNIIKSFCKYPPMIRYKYMVYHWGGWDIQGSTLSNFHIKECEVVDAKELFIKKETVKMRELDKTKCYTLEHLTKKELKQVYKATFKPTKEYKCVYYFDATGWSYTSVVAGRDVTNAKELFYTLENIQVDCRELTDEQIKEMAKVFELGGYKIDYNYLYVSDSYCFINFHSEDQDVWMTLKDENKTTITYDKLIELFAPPAAKPTTHEYDQNSFTQITNSIASLLEYKNEKYGNSALYPLNIFTNKCKVGQRLDDKLARIKNSNELKKNDVADLIGYLVLTCKENNWTNFDEFKD